MANANNPCGFKPYGEILRVGRYTCGTNPVYPGDACVINSSGLIDSAVEASASLCGVALNYATTGQDILIADDPDQKFTAKTDGTSLSAQTVVGNTIGLEPGSPSTAYKDSRMALDDELLNTTALTFQILSLGPTIGNAFGDYASVIVRINQHQLRYITGAVGV